MIGISSIDIEATTVLIVCLYLLSLRLFCSYKHHKLLSEFAKKYVLEARPLESAISA